MQRRFRLSRSEDFKRVRRTGKSYAHPLVVLVTQACETHDHTRVGVTAGKTTGTAVHRNRAKRLLREAMRPLLPSIASGWDLILIAHPLVVLVTQACETHDHTRVGVTAGKTTGTAVHRNRAKRLLREAMRPLLPSIASGWDLILIARPALVTATLTDTRAALTNLLRRANLLLVDESRT